MLCNKDGFEFLLLLTQEDSPIFKLIEESLLIMTNLGFESIFESLELCGTLLD